MHDEFTVAGTEGSRATVARAARPRPYLMCSPTFFDVTYSINPWMDPNKPIDAALAMAQWERLHDLYREFGHEVEFIEPVEGLPDMVFSANGATVVDGRVLLAKFRHDERAGEAAAYREWFGAQGYRKVKEPEFINEGEGDYLVTGRRILAGAGFRTDRHSHGEARELLGRPVISLKLVDPRFYHLDTALAVLDDDEIMYYPAAFSPGSQAVLRRRRRVRSLVPARRRSGGWPPAAAPRADHQIPRLLRTAEGWWRRQVLHVGATRVAVRRRLS